MKSFYTALLFCLPVFVLFAQPAIQWQKSYGGSGDEEAHSIIQTSDGGFIIAGISKSNNGDVSGNHVNNTNGLYEGDYWLVKTDASGNIQWQKCLGGSSAEEAFSIIQTSDGGYMVVGRGFSQDGDVSFTLFEIFYWVVKLDASGNIQWEKPLGGSQGQSRAYSVVENNDGSFIVAGESWAYSGNVTNPLGGKDYWLVKLDASGSIIWDKNYGGLANDEYAKIVPTADGGFILAGFSNSTDNHVSANIGMADYWIVKIDFNGNIQWEKSYGGTNIDYGRSIQQTSDGGYIVAGSTSSNDVFVTGHHGLHDFWILKLDNNGNLTWQKALGGTGGDFGYSVKETSDGGFVVAGITNSNDGDVTGNHGSADYWVVKLDPSGNLLWQKTLGGSGIDQARSIALTSDGGVVVAGRSASNDGDVSGNHGGYDYWVVKLGNVTGVSNMEDRIIFSLYPNPANNLLFIQGLNDIVIRSVSITDLQGRTIKVSEAKNNNALKQGIDISSLENGIYFINITDGNTGLRSARFIKAD